MKTGDYLRYTLAGDSAGTPNTYAAQITAIDPANAYLTCRNTDTGTQYTFHYLTNASGPWDGNDDQGADCSSDTHDIFTAGGTDPTPQGVAVVTFADNKSYLCSVNSISPTIDVTFYNSPFHQLSFDTSNGITQSDWDAYPTGGTIQSIQGYVPADTSTGPTPTPVTNNAPKQPYDTESWRGLLTQTLTDIPLGFALAWVRTESGGNPCAFGNANAFGPDGNPLEMGLGQLYNPDDFQSLGINTGPWRAYCTAGTQNVTRDLTAAECASQVAGLIGLINRCRTAARRVNPGWDETSADFWRLVKLNHALPGLLQGMNVVTQQLGHPPATWAEFRATVVNVQLDANTMKYAGDFNRELDNAEATGGAI